MAIKRANKVDLAAVIMAECGVNVSPDALFDVQIKRLHEYKRRIESASHHGALCRLLQNRRSTWCRGCSCSRRRRPRIRFGEEHHSRHQSRRERINADNRLGGKLKVAFLPITGFHSPRRLFRRLTSRTISTAGKEASGTGT
jgi:starch phosphorylase